jgi:hypothetical protein
MGGGEGYPAFLKGLLFTTRERTALARAYFNRHVWKPALEAAGPGKPSTARSRTREASGGRRRM